MLFIFGEIDFLFSFAPDKAKARQQATAPIRDIKLQAL